MTSRPFEPGPDPGREEIAAADPGPGAPPQAPGYGREAEEPDRPEMAKETEDDEEDPPAHR